MEFLEKRNIKKNECFLVVKGKKSFNNSNLIMRYNHIGIDVIELFGIEFNPSNDSHEFIKKYILPDNIEFNHIKINTDLYKITIHRNGEKEIYSYIKFNPNTILYGNNSNNSNSKELKRALEIIGEDFENLFKCKINFSNSKIKKIELNTDFNYKLGLFNEFAEYLFINEKTKHGEVKKQKNNEKTSDKFNIKPALTKLEKLLNPEKKEKVVKKVKCIEFIKPLIDENIEKTKEFKETYKGLTPKNIRIETLESIFYQGKNFSVKLYDKKKELKNHKININQEKTRLELTLNSRLLRHYYKKYNLDGSIESILKNFNLYQDIYRYYFRESLIRNAVNRVKSLKGTLRREYLNYKKNSLLERKNGNNVKSIWKYLLELNYFDKDYLIEISKEYDKYHTSRNKKYIENYNFYKERNKYELEELNFWWDVPKEYRNINNNIPLEELKKICNY